MKLILRRRCRNGVNEIQVFHRVSNERVIYSLWLEGEYRAVLESVNQISGDQADNIQTASINSDWQIEEAFAPIE